MASTMASTMASAKAVEAARAVNSFLHFSARDQDALLDVMEEFFCTPSRTEADNSDMDDGNDTELDPDETGGVHVHESRGEAVLHSPVDSPEQDQSDTEDEPTHEQQVQEALQNVPSIYGTEVEFRQCDTDEEEVVANFVATECSCVKQCSSQFSKEHIQSMRAQCLQLSRNELDMVLMGQLIASTNTSDKVVQESRHLEKERERTYSTYNHAGKPVCAKTFLFLHTVGKKRLRNLSLSLRENGLTPRVHGNSRRLPKHSLSYQAIEYVVRFLLTYSEQHALLLPGRIPGYSRSDMKLLPSSVSKRGIWRVYRSAAESSESIHQVAYTTFCRLWRQLLPSILIMKPMSDLCWTCQQNSTAILRAANASEGDKSETIKAAEEHLRIVQVERSFYKTTCDTCRHSVQTYFTEDDALNLLPLSSNTPPNSRDIQVHYSFDYAQQVHFPSDPLQPGPIYFLTPCKCSVFGVNCESFPRQVNFLTDEAGECGKGANNVISRLHFFFKTHGLGEKVVFLHADNCTGQNKNNAMIHYLAWRAATQQHTSLTLSFLVVGHTKFAPDWCFGLFKRLYKRTKVGSLRSVAQVVNESAQCNFAQLVSQEDGSTVVPTYDWTSFFVPQLKKIPGIKKLHHFRCVSSEPGVVYVKEHADTVERKITLSKSATTWSPDPNILPPVVPPKGLSAERQWYLFDTIREFCPDSDKDITCPLPDVSRPTSSAPGTPARVAPGTPARVAPTVCPGDDGVEPPSKRRRCGVCREEGHNSRSCPNKET